MITGAAGGLGRAFAAECAGRGWKLVLTDVNAAGLEAVRAGLARQYGAEIFAAPCDLTEERAVRDFARALRARGVALDMLLNIAGLDHEGGFLRRDFRQIAAIIRVNIEATLRGTHELLSLRRAGARFTVVFASSLASLYPMPLKATYAASKRFLRDFSLALGEELRGENVRTLSLCPAGLATTEEARRAIAAQGFWGAATANRVERVVSRTLRRALSGRRQYIPGVLNAAFGVFGRIVPAGVVARLLHARWSKSQGKWMAA
jgi:short-subunit dehydrogenase